MPDADAETITRQHRLSSTTDVPLTYAEYRPPGIARGDVLMVHGLASSGRQFHHDALQFAGEGYRVLVPDLRGHGGSGVPSGVIRREDFTIPVMAADLVDILDHAQVDRVHWVGNSLGGILALWLLGTPHAARLRSLALFGSCFSMRLPAQVGQVLRLAFLPGARVTGWLTARISTGNPVGREVIAQAIRELNVNAGAAIAANVRSYDFVANAQAFPGPMLVLRGGRDHAVNLGLRRDIGKFAGQAGFRRVELPRGGHCANFDMPEQFRQALREHWSPAASGE